MDSIAVSGQKRGREHAGRPAAGHEQNTYINRRFGYAFLVPRNRSILERLKLAGKASKVGHFEKDLEIDVAYISSFKGLGICWA